jgi:transposase
VAAAVIGDVRDISRFPSRDCFAAYNGTAPAGVSSGNRVICRLSLRGNRRAAPCHRVIFATSSGADLAGTTALCSGRCALPF